MEQLFIENPIISITLTIVMYVIAHYISLILSKIKISFIPAIITSVVFICAFLKIFNISYSTYNEGGKFISSLATPATITLALHMYRRKQMLKENIIIILFSISIGILFGFVSTFLLVKYAFKLDDNLLGSLLSKSITTPISIELSDKIGGVRSIAILGVFISGILGAGIAPFVYKFFKIKSPLSKGLGLGTASHAMGTIKAIELGQTEASMSSLALIISAIISVTFIPLLLKLFNMIFQF